MPLTPSEVYDNEDQLDISAPQEAREDMEPGEPLPTGLEDPEEMEMEPALMEPPPQAPSPLVQPQQPLAGPTPPPAAFPQQPTMPAGSPFVPFTIGRRDPVTGQMTTTTGFGRRAIPPDPNAEFWNRLRQRTSNLPLAQTEAAVSAAMRFQGLRQYQRDLQSGMAPAEAIARAAPLIFNAPRQSSLGQAAQFMRSSRAPAARVRDVGGVLFRENAKGGWDPITPAKSVAPKVNPFDTEEYRSNLTELRNIEKSLVEPGVSATERATLARRGRALQKNLSDIRARYQTAGTGTHGEVIRWTKDGRKAVFDSATRKFIRYAD